MKIKIIKANKYNWYKKGQIFEVLNYNKYQPYGVQVVTPNNGRCPDVVDNEHFIVIEE